MASRLQDLEQRAIDVLAIPKTIPEFKDAKVAIIEGMALWKYLPQYPTTQDVAFCITAAGAPGSVKTKLLALPDSAFKLKADHFIYEAKGTAVQIDFVNTNDVNKPPRLKFNEGLIERQLPYLPAAATPLRSLPSNTLPYISAVDLVVYKIFGCELRPTALKKRRDADNAYVLLTHITRSEKLALNREQKACLTDAVLEDVVKYVQNSDLKWRKKMLGL